MRFEASHLEWQGFQILTIVNLKLCEAIGGGQASCWKLSTPDLCKALNIQELCCWATFSLTLTLSFCIPKSQGA